VDHAAGAQLVEHMASAITARTRSWSVVTVVMVAPLLWLVVVTGTPARMTSPSRKASTARRASG
jgi:hypothetical protein